MLSVAVESPFVGFEDRLTTFCIDPFVHEIFRPRIDACLRNRTALEELEYLRQNRISSYQRSHELLAYHYFALTKHNQRRRSNCMEADFEYIPLLPLSWKIEFPERTTCTAGDICPKIAVEHDLCSAKFIVRDILSYIRYMKSTRQQPLNSGVPRFFVSSAFNLKTVMGRGMSLAVRRGEEYEQISSFIETTFLAHYERLPQCADILRKHWKYIVEMPYVPLFGSQIPNDRVSYQSTYRTLNPELLQPTTPLLKAVKSKFFFSGRILLWGSERICSVRVAMLQLLIRKDTTVVYIGTNESEGHAILNPAYYRSLSMSDFCLIGRADSHTTAAFYEALSALCIPVVISDWFVFSYRWWIPYHEFVVRVAEDQFLANPNAVLDHISASYNSERIKEMKSRMSEFKKYLSYNFFRMEAPAGSEIDVIYPFDMLLIELKKGGIEEMAAHVRDPNVKPENFFKRATGPMVCLNPLKCFPNVPVLRVDKIIDNRAHLCKHSSRLIGRYKIVYFLQCVRMFWTLKPGEMKPVDSDITESELEFVNMFHNISKIPVPYETKWDVYPNGLFGNTVDNALNLSVPIFSIRH